jgi:Flp pilus assembly protein TadG
MIDFWSNQHECTGRDTGAKRRGIATVECAVILPVFVLILLGTMEACSMIFLRQSVELAAYEASRTAVLPQTTLLNVQSTASSLLTSRKIKNCSVTVTPTTFQSAAYGSFIRVTVKAPVSDNSLFGSIFYKNMTIDGSVEFMKEF